MSKTRVAKALFRVFAPAVICMITFAVVYSVAPTRMEVEPPPAPRVEQPSKAEMDAAFYELVERKDAEVVRSYTLAKCKTPDKWPKGVIPAKMLLRTGVKVEADGSVDMTYEVKKWTYPVKEGAVLALCP